MAGNIKVTQIFAMTQRGDYIQHGDYAVYLCRALKSRLLQVACSCGNATVLGLVEG